MFAVIRTGGKQYRVSENDVIVVEKLAGDAGAKVDFDQVLMVGEPGKAPSVGTPVVAGASVSAEIIEQTRGKKIIVFKKKRRQNYRRKNGHRQDLTVLRVTGISAAGGAKKAAKKAAPEAASAPQADTAVDTAAENKE